MGVFMTRRAIISVQIIADYAVEQGMALDLLLDGSDIDSGQLEQIDLEITAAQELQVLDNLLAYTGDAFRLGMDLGLRYQLTSYGIFGYALLASKSVRQAIEFGIRYVELTYAFSHIRLIEEDGKAALTFSMPEGLTGDKQLACLLVIRDMWAVTIMQNEILSPQDVGFHMEFEFSRPDHLGLAGLSELEALLGGEIKFGATRNAFIGPVEILDQLLNKANAATAKLCEQQCQQLLQQKQSWQAVATLVRDALLHLGLTASMEEVAYYLARSPRTLHRQLAKEQSSWRGIRDTVRMGLAEELLAQSITLDEITERLGYSDVSNFSHAFKRYFNCSPISYRQRLQASKL